MCGPGAAFRDRATPSPTHTVKRDTDPLWAETVSHSKVLSCEKHPQKSGVFEHRNSSEGKDTTPRSKSQVFTFSWAILPRHMGTTTGQPSEAVGRWRGGAAERVSFPVGGKARDMELVTTRTKGSKSVQEKEPALQSRRFAHNCPQCGQLRRISEGVPNIRIFPFRALLRRESPCLQGKLGRSCRGSKKSRRSEHG